MICTQQKLLLFVFTLKAFHANKIHVQKNEAIEICVLFCHVLCVCVSLNFLAAAGWRNAYNTKR